MHSKLPGQYPLSLRYGPLLYQVDAQSNKATKLEYFETHVNPKYLAYVKQPQHIFPSIKTYFLGFTTLDYLDNICFEQQQ